MPAIHSKFGIGFFTVASLHLLGTSLCGDGSVDAVDQMELGEPYRESRAAGAVFTGLSEVIVVKPEDPQEEFSDGSTYYDHGDPTDYEQLMLERVNRARGDPGAEAARLGIDLNQGLAPGTIADTPKQPLAPSRFLTLAAREHSAWMLDSDTFSHTGEGGSSPSERMSAAGYLLDNGWSTGENIGWSGSTGAIDLEARTLRVHENLFKSPGHRINICENDFQELGIGILEGLFLKEGTNWNAVMATQNFARSGATPGPFVTGVVYEDFNENGLYDPGEGMGGIVVSVTGSSYYGETSSSGGYAVPVAAAAAAEEVRFTGADWEESQNITLEGSRNLKADLVIGEPPAWYVGAADLGGSWRWFDWLGSFNVSFDPWIFHAEHGWLFPFADGPESVYFWDGVMGSFLWTSATVYPSMYRFSDGKWIFYQKGSTNPRHFVDLATGVWEQW